jgi:hypothetical protein
VTKVVREAAVSHKFTLDGVGVLFSELLGVSAALDHKALDNAVENESLEKVLADELEKILNGDGSLVGIKLGGHCAEISYCNFDDGILCCHFYIFLSGYF